MTSEKADRDALLRAFRARRHVLGLTQDAVAERAGVSKSTVSRFETGHSDPPPETLEQILHAVESTMPELERLASTAGGPAPYEWEPAELPSAVAGSTPDQLVEYMHALIASIRFRHPEKLSRLAAVLTQAHDRAIARPEDR